MVPGFCSCPDGEGSSPGGGADVSSWLPLPLFVGGTPDPDPDPGEVRVGVLLLLLLSLSGSSVRRTGRSEASQMTFIWKPWTMMVLPGAGAVRVVMVGKMVIHADPVTELCQVKTSMGPVARLVQSRTVVPSKTWDPENPLWERPVKKD